MAQPSLQPGRKCFDAESKTYLQGALQIPYLQPCRMSWFVSPKAFLVL